MNRTTCLFIGFALAGGLYYTVQNGKVAAAPEPNSSEREDLGSSAVSSARPRPPETPVANQGLTPVVTTEATEQELPILRSAIGWIEPTATVTVQSRIDGQIIRQYVRDGETVKAGSPLFLLESREIQAQIAYDEATLARNQATLEKAETDVRRVRELLAKSIASRAEAEQLEVDVKVAAANVAASEAALEATRIKLSHADIRAPISGRIGVVRATEGNVVRASDTSGDGLLTITQMTPLRVSFSLPERDIGLLQTALATSTPTATVRVLGEGAGEVIATGQLEFVDSSIDTASGTILTKAVLADGAGLWPGQYVRVEARFGTRPGIVTVPIVAVQPGQDGSHVFVVEPDNTVEMRPVDVAEIRGDQAAISGGLAPGERVVIEGQLRLRDGSKVAVTNPAAPRHGDLHTADAKGRP